MIKLNSDRAAFSLVVGLAVGVLLAFIYSYAAVYMPIVNGPDWATPFFRAHPMTGVIALSVITRTLPLALLMFVLAAAASRILKSSTLGFAVLVVTGWLLSSFILIPALDGNVMGFLASMVRVWFVVVPVVVLTTAALFWSILRCGYHP